MTGRLGPHEGRELELMKAGVKKLAYFYYDSSEDPQDYIPEEFEELAKQGQLGRFANRVSVPDIRLDYWQVFFTLPGEEWRAKVFVLVNTIWNDPGLPITMTTEDIQRMEGALLGYDRVDIDFFIEHWKRD